MASGGSDSFSVLCNECNKLVDVFNGNVQLSMEIHRKKIHSLPNKQRQHFNQVFKGQDRYKNEEYENFFCPLCKKSVEILKSNFTRGIQEHVKSHDHVEVKPKSDDQLYTFSGIKTWIDNSIKSEKSERSSNAFKNNQRRQNVERNTVRLPFDLKQHRGYIVDQGDNISCSVCAVTFDSSNIVEHLKTKIHEDNVILLFKEKLPMHLQHSMEFISFYNSNLSCNLCRCKINLNSVNLYETIFNIISHNSDTNHSNKRQNEPITQNDVASSLMKFLADKYPVISDNKHLIETHMEPQFKCKLCDKGIIYSDKVDILAKNCFTHLNSLVHKKSEKALSILKSIESLNISQGKHSFTVLNGNITCVTCKSKLETDINNVLDHLSEVAQFKQPDNQGSSLIDHSNQSVKSYQSDRSSEPAVNQKRPFGTRSTKGNNTQANPDKENSKMNKPNYRQLLKSLQQEFGNISRTITQNSNGKILCTVCDCPVPPTTSSIRLHLLGNPHKNKIQQLAQPALNPTSGDQTKLKDRIELLFQSLPQKFQQDKPFIRDSPIDGYIVCSICDCVINPYYIRDHLIDENHLQEKKKLFGST